jgi:uncharacterized protein (DUF362 family)
LTQWFDELKPQDWVMIHPSGSHWKKGFPFARPCLEAEALVQTCCLKTHRYGGHFTMSLKNSVGMVAKRHPLEDHDFMQELHSSSHQRRMIAEINAAYSPALIVLDGVDAFISGGPDDGKRVSPEVILLVAIEWLLARLVLLCCATLVARQRLVGKIFQQSKSPELSILVLG